MHCEDADNAKDIFQVAGWLMNAQAQIVVGNLLIFRNVVAVSRGAYPWIPLPSE